MSFKCMCVFRRGSLFNLMLNSCGTTKASQYAAGLFPPRAKPSSCPKAVTGKGIITAFANSSP